MYPRLHPLKLHLYQTMPLFVQQNSLRDVGITVSLHSPSNTAELADTTTKVVKEMQRPAIYTHSIVHVVD